MKVSPVSFGTFRVFHVDKKTFDEIHQEVGKTLEENGYEYNDQTDLDEYVYKVPSADFKKECLILDKLYYTNRYWPDFPRVYATSVRNTDNGRKELFLTGENEWVEHQAAELIDNLPGYGCSGHS